VFPRVAALPRSKQKQMLRDLAQHYEKDAALLPDERTEAIPLIILGA
jgi:hypothetical protein